MSRHSRCLVLMAKKDWQAALPECNEALDIWREGLGPNHPDTSLALKNVGRILFELGRAEEGCLDIANALAIEETSLGAEHPTIAGTLLFSSDCRAARGESQDALALDLRALAIREKKLGPTHPRTGEILAQVARRYADVHDAAHEKEYLARAAAIRPSP